MNIQKLLMLGSVLMLVASLPQAAISQNLDTDILSAIQESNVPALAIWFADGGDINGTTRQGNTLLILASRIGDRQTIDFLMSQLPDVNAQNAVGATALMLAAKYGHAHVVELLLENGADPLIRNNNGFTASRFALAYNHDEVFKRLQQAELQPRASNPNS